MADLLSIRRRRRAALTQLLGTAGGLAVGLGLGGARPALAQPAALTVSGGGVNLKFMPAPSGGAMVPLREVFAFDAHYAQCIIEDNPEAFAMETFALGRVVIEPHAFFMAMYSTAVRLVGITGAGERRVATLEGVLDCHTFGATADVSLGSRTAAEPAAFAIEATDTGASSSVPDAFAFTVFFEPATAPVNYAIFGPSPTFTGELIAGRVTIAPAVGLPPS